MVDDFSTSLAIWKCGIHAHFNLWTDSNSLNLTLLRNRNFLGEGELKSLICYRDVELGIRLALTQEQENHPKSILHLFY